MREERGEQKAARKAPRQLRPSRLRRRGYANGGCTTIVTGPPGSTARAHPSGHGITTLSWVRVKTELEHS